MELATNSWEPQSLELGVNQQKQYVFLDPNNESVVFTLSSSDGGNKQEDCALMIWDTATLEVPDNSYRVKKNHDYLPRNCVHPKIVGDTVLAITEYFASEDYTGFTTFKLSLPAYNI